MADPNNDTELNKWQRAVHRQWNSTAIRPNFNTDLDDLRQYKLTIEEVLQARQSPKVSRIIAFITKYNLPLAVFQMLDSYIQSGKLNFGLIGPTIEIYPKGVKNVLDLLIETPELTEERRKFWSGIDVYLKIDPNVEKTELTEFITDHWDNLIEPRLIALGRNRKNKRSQRIEPINKLILKLHNDGDTPKIIAEKVNEKFPDYPVTYDADLVGKRLRDLSPNKQNTK